MLEPLDLAVLIITSFYLIKLWLNFNLMALCACGISLRYKPCIAIAIEYFLYHYIILHYIFVSTFHTLKCFVKNLGTSTDLHRSTQSYAYNPVTWESEARGFPWIWHHPGLCSEFQACLGSFRRPCLKLKKKAVKEISCGMSVVGSGFFTVWSFMLFTFWPHCHIAGTFHVPSASRPLILLMSVPVQIVAFLSSSLWSCFCIHFS